MLEPLVVSTAVRAACHVLAVQTRDRINEMTGLASIYPESTDWFSQMFVARLPKATAAQLREVLWLEFKIEIPPTRRE